MARNLLLQGEVEQISLMPPKAEKEGDTGLLEYLEDIIGTNKYIEPIKEASVKLEALTEEKQKQIQRVKTAGSYSIRSQPEPCVQVVACVLVSRCTNDAHNTNLSCREESEPAGRGKEAC